MWTVKNPHFIKQKDRNPTACPFFNLSAQFNEKTLNIAPLNIATRWPRKNQFDNSLMSTFHSLMVPVSGTECNSDLLMAKWQVNVRSWWPKVSGTPMQDAQWFGHMSFFAEMTLKYRISNGSFGHFPRFAVVINRHVGQ